MRRSVRVSLWSKGAGTLALVLCSCRFGYEIATDQAASVASGGTSGGDGDSIGDGDAAGGGLGDGDSAGDGGSNSSGGGSNSSGGSDPGTGGADNGIGGSGSAGSGGAGTGGGTADYEVETGEDTQGGSLLSLRDAILLTNAGGGGEVISLSGHTIALDAALPPITQGVTIVGDGGAIDGLNAGNVDCVFVDADNVTFDGVEVHDCSQSPIVVASGTGSEVVNCYFHDNQDALFGFAEGFVVRNNLFEAAGSTALAIHGSGSTIADNVIVDSGFRGIFLDNSADGAVLIGNLIARSASAAIFAANLTGATLWHNTVVESGDIGIILSGTGFDVRNNLITHCAGAAVSGSDNDFAVFDHNLVFANGGPVCTSCSSFPGPNTLTADPNYADFGSTYTISASSPAVDQGALVTTDRNGAASGDFDGSGFDIGHAEVQ